MAEKGKDLYHFNYSQEVIRLQSKYALFKRVLNILFSITFDDGFDEGLMRQALEKLYERNDCLRLRFVKQGKETMQFFEPERKPGEIPSLRFHTNKAYENFFRRFRRKATDPAKGDVLRVVFAVNPEGKQMVICKISHYAADTYGIGVLAQDLMAIYYALRDGKELPPAPGSFEEIIRKDNEYREDTAATERDRAYLHEYFFKLHGNHPVYCGTHGNQSDRWLKAKRKGKFAIPMLFIRCDTYPFQFVVPADITRQAEKWCEEHAISLNSLFFMGFILTLSLINDRETRLCNVEILNCRGSLADRKTAGTKAQGMAVCTEIDYGKGFLANTTTLSEEQKELYRHTRLSYLGGEVMQHDAWKYSMLDMINGSGFSYIPFIAHDGVQLSLHSNGKGALITYVALMHDITHNEIFINYDVQKLLVTPKQLTDFHNRYVRVLETVLADSETPLGQLL